MFLFLTLAYVLDESLSKQSMMIQETSSKESALVVLLVPSKGVHAHFKRGVLTQVLVIPIACKYKNQVALHAVLLPQSINHFTS
jgi:hypothetical protein